jgi:putative hydrolase of the HAD superfamily
MPDEFTGLLVDWGGVLTTNVFASFESFCRREGLPPERVRDLFRSDPRGHELLVGLETGELAEADFERELGALIGVDGDDLIVRLMTGTQLEQSMLDLLRAARRSGVATGLISNSWGVTRYDQGLLNELFDGVVISGYVGIRKPAPEIYEMGARAIGVEPAACVYVDDLPGNLKPARALGMHTLHHRSPATTIAELADLFPDSVISGLWLDQVWLRQP